MIKKYLNNEKGFSMIEMMVVLIIIAVLIGGGIRFYLGYIENARVTKAKAQISVMQAALDAYYAEQGNYPEDNAGLLNAGIATTDTEKKIEATDPWGIEYKYDVSTDSSKYVVYTGKEDVQNKPNTYVEGRGDDGNSHAPEVVTTEEDAPEA